MPERPVRLRGAVEAMRSEARRPPWASSARKDDGAGFATGFEQAVLQGRPMRGDVLHAPAFASNRLAASAGWGGVARAIWRVRGGEDEPAEHLGLSVAGRRVHPAQGGEKPIRRSSFANRFATLARRSGDGVVDAAGDGGHLDGRWDVKINSKARRMTRICGSAVRVVLLAAIPACAAVVCFAPVGSILGCRGEERGWLLDREGEWRWMIIVTTRMISTSLRSARPVHHTGEG